MIEACEECLRRSYAAADVTRPSTFRMDAACVHSARYPGDLLDLHDPPPVLYASDLRSLSGKREAAVVMVGSRRPSEYGRSVAYRLARDLAEADVPVVSGMALGIDAIAHAGCLDGGGQTVAVLAGGADVVYPRTNRRLYERIHDAGAIVSEMPPGTTPTRWLFPARNRIMAALGRVTVVIEATERSGTLITADCAADLGRDVAAVPGPVTSALAAGTNGLLRHGAALVTCAQDVLDLLFGVGAREVPTARPSPLEERERLVLEGVSHGEGLESIARAAGLDAAALRATLARLELRGLVRRAGAGSYVAVA